VEIQGSIALSRKNGWPSRGLMGGKTVVGGKLLGKGEGVSECLA
jgi:hypothetical protein